MKVSFSFSEQTKLTVALTVKTDVRQEERDAGECWGREIVRGRKGLKVVGLV